MTGTTKGQQLEEIKCGRCTQINYINPNLVHGENGDPFTLYCTYCKAEIHSEVILYDKVTIITNTAFLLNQIFQRTHTVESNSLDGKLLKWVRRQHERSWSKDRDPKRDFVKVTFELSEGSNSSTIGDKGN